MKLVQLLAKELKEWPEGAAYAVQDGDSRKTIKFAGHGSTVGFELLGTPSVWQSRHWMFGSGKDFDVYGLSSDYKTSMVTLTQWQAEREKMNKPKWIRHRGGKCPVPCGTKVETRHRDGNTYSPHFHTQNSRSEVATNVVWKHQGDAMDIMAYRIIEQTKDQEIEEVKVTDVKLEMMQGDSWVTIGRVAPDFVASVFDGGQLPKDEEVKDTNIGTLTYKLEIDATETTKEIDSLVAKWGQIESPLKWRDAIIHCQAIIEDCEREIERNTQQLAHEGFLLIALITDVSACVPAVDMSDPENWQEGDIVVCVKEEGSCAVLDTGKEYALRISDGYLGLVDEEGDHMCVCLTNGQLEFVRRP